MLSEGSVWCCEGGWYEEEVLSEGGVGGGAVCNEGREGRRDMIEGNRWLY